MDFGGVRTAPLSTVAQGVAQSTIAVDKTLTVRFDNTVDVKCLAARDVTVAVGDMVLGIKSRGRIVIVARLYAAAPSSPDEGTGVPNPEPAVRYGTLVCHPIETRTYRAVGGWVTAHDDTLQGSQGSAGSLAGCAFYGAKPRSLFGAEVLSATLKLKRLTDGYSPNTAATLYRVSQDERPAGAPTLLSPNATGPSLALGEEVDYSLSASWAQNLVDSAAGGLAIQDPAGAGYLRFAGRSEWAAAWTLIIEWKRAA